MPCGMLQVYSQSAYSEAARDAPYCPSGGSRLLPGAPHRFPRYCYSHAILCRTLSERTSHFPAPPALQTVVITEFDSLGRNFPSHLSVPDQAQSMVLPLMLQLHHAASVLAESTASTFICSNFHLQHRTGLPAHYLWPALHLVWAGNECRDILWHSIAYGLKQQDFQMPT